MKNTKLVEIPIFDESPQTLDVKINCLPDEVIEKTPHTFKSIWKSFPKLLLFVLLLEAAVIYGMLFFIAPGSASKASEASNLLQPTVNAETLIAMTNSQRLEYGLKPLEFNLLLTEAANNKANYILSNNSFDHSSLNGETFSSWIKEVDYQYLRVGENLAINYESPEDIIKAWMKSPTHKKNLLNPLYDEIGIATLPGNFDNKDTIIVVQMFGTPE